MAGMEQEEKEGGGSLGRKALLRRQVGLHVVTSQDQLLATSQDHPLVLVLPSVAEELHGQHRVRAPQRVLVVVRPAEARALSAVEVRYFTALVAQELLMAQLIRQRE